MGKAVMKWCALIPLRGGSKSIPRKNVKPLAGKPLFYWAIKAAYESDSFEQFWVSTDCEEIAAEVKLFFPSIQILMRPSELAEDTSSTESVVEHFLEKVNSENVALIQVTSPLTTPADFQKAKQKFENDAFDSLLTGTTFTRFVWKTDGKPINYSPKSRPRRQEMLNQCQENGAFYLFSSEGFKKNGCRLFGKIGIHLMAEDTATEIDEPSDWEIVERLVRRSLKKTSFSPKVVFIDVDGTLTDGGMYYSEEGEKLKKFNTRDWKGMSLLQDAGIRPVIITGESSQTVHARVKKVGIEDYFHGITDKATLIKELLIDWGLKADQCAFIGDDLNDLEAMEIVGFSACPADAVDEVRATVDYISSLSGGAGAVRDVIARFLGG
jgi:YrbI family 3-deoxy-D-manno-octulosonate 8-phosphate phosphatase